MNTYDQRELKSELSNALSHGLGILFTLISSPVLISKAIFSGASESMVFGVAVYSFSMLLMFSFSTLYHAFFNPYVKQHLRIFDHISIFFLIGGSYIPFVLMFTSSPTAFWFLSVQWTLIFLGTIMKVFYTGQYRLLSSIIYISIGSMVMILGSAFWSSMKDFTFWLLVSGGLSYLVGVIFYQNRRIPNNHLIWHLFVLLAAVLHYFAVYSIL